jgi:hypothetical protein
MITEFIPDPEDLAALELYEQGQKVTAQQTAGFPLESLPQTLRDICQEIIEVRSVSPDIVGPCALAMVSAAAGKGYEVRTFADLTVRANIYVLLAAPSGTGKGRAVSRLIEPLAQEQIAVLRDNQERMLELRETLDVSKERYGGLKKTLAKGDFKTPEFEAQVRYDMKWNHNRGSLSRIPASRHWLLS